MKQIKCNKCGHQTTRIDNLCSHDQTQHVETNVIHKVGLLSSPVLDIPTCRRHNLLQAKFSVSCEIIYSYEILLHNHDMPNICYDMPNICYDVPNICFDMPNICS